MISTSTAEPIPFTPPWLEGKPDAPVYRLRAGSVIERGQFEAELAGRYRAGRVYGHELRAAVRSGVETLLAGDQSLDHLLGLIEAEAEGEEVELSNEDKLLLAEVRSTLAEHWPEYRELTAQLERRREIAPIVALQWFCVGWEGCKGDGGNPAVFAQDRYGRVTEAALLGLAPLEMMVAGNRCYGLQYALGQEGNSPPPTPSDVGPATSVSDAPSKAAGRSKGKPGRKTPASRSRRGSGRSSTSTSSAAATPDP